MSEVVYQQSYPCKRGRHSECGNLNAIVRGGICCICVCHPRGDEDRREFLVPA